MQVRQRGIGTGDAEAAAASRRKSRLKQVMLLRRAYRRGQSMRARPAKWQVKYGAFITQMPHSPVMFRFYRYARCFHLRHFRQSAYALFASDDITLTLLIIGCWRRVMPDLMGIAAFAIGAFGFGKMRVMRHYRNADFIHARPRRSPHANTPPLF